MGGEAERGTEGGVWGLGVCHTLWGQDMIARGTLPNNCNQCNLAYYTLNESPTIKKKRFIFKYVQKCTYL